MPSSVGSPRMSSRYGYWKPFKKSDYRRLFDDTRNSEESEIKTQGKLSWQLALGLLMTWMVVLHM